MIGGISVAWLITVLTTGGILVTCFTTVLSTGGAVKIFGNGSVGLLVGFGVFVGMGTEVFVASRTGAMMVFVARLAGEG